MAENHRPAKVSVRRSIDDRVEHVDFPINPTRANVRSAHACCLATCGPIGASPYREKGSAIRVLSDIRDQYETLTNQGYRDIVGIRDVFPLPNADIPQIRADFRALAPRNPIEPTLVLSIREIEAWFICEHTHFQRRDKRLTHARITAELGYDPSAHDVQTIPSPANDLKAAYSIARLLYNKSRKTIQRVVEHLDYARVYLEMRRKLFPTSIHLSPGSTNS